jgi:rod shape-determining protein MreC
MERLFLFVYANRAFVTFLLLELFCAWLIVENNRYQGAKFFNSSNSFIAETNNVSQGVREYFQLREINRTLAEENASLRNQLQKENPPVTQVDSLTVRDSLSVTQFVFVSAKVMNNSVDRFTNFLTINRGTNDGLEAGMAVISPQGAVGKIKTVSNHYSIVTSLLNVDVMTSALLKRTGHFGTIQWDGKNPNTISLKYIPRHVKPLVGDTVVTSGYNAIFPEGIMIGVVSEVKLREEDPFNELKVKLSQDFRKLSYVSVVKSMLKHEQDSLEQSVTQVVR